MVFGRRNSKDNSERKIMIERQVANGVVTYARSCHPNEGILILQGTHKKNLTTVTGLVIPPFSTRGPYYSGFPTYELPFDLSYMGTVHSHPGGTNRPSLEDLHNFYGVISLIICHPYEFTDIFAFDRNGNKIDFEIYDAQK